MRIIFFLLLAISLFAQDNQRHRPVTRKQPYFNKPVTLANLSTSYAGISGIARPTLAANAGYVFICNDNVGSTALVALNTSTGATAGEWALQGVTRVDFEDISSANVNGTAYLYVADFGNNSNTADSRGSGIDLKIYRCPEPTITGSNGTITSGTIEMISCAFPAPGTNPSLRDCETLLVDKVTGDMYAITKRIYPARIYRLKHAASYSGTQTLEYLGKLCTDTSSTSLAIGTGSKTFTVDRGLTWGIGMRLRAQSRASQSNWMEGVVTACSPTSLTIYVEVNTPTLTEPALGGSGTLADWDISLPISYTPTANNGNTTGGCITPDNSQVLIRSYGQLYVFPRGKSIFDAISQAPRVAANPPGNAWYRHNMTDVPGFPQGEALDFVDATGNTLLMITEWNSGKGSTNPMVTLTRASKPVHIVRLQPSADTYIDSNAASTSQATAASLISDINFQGATTYSAVATASGGAASLFTVSSGTGFAVGKKARVSTQNSGGSNYVGTWEVTAVSGTSITLAVPFTATTTGNISAHIQDREALVKFDIASGIPAGATITDAVLRLFINTEGESYSVHKMKSSWVATDTYNSLGAIATDANVKAYAIADHVTPSGQSNYVGFYDLPIPNATVQSWLDGGIANNGFFIQQVQSESTGNGFQWDSVNSATASRVPLLIVSYTMP
jgi:hypothetical protein